MHDIAKVLIGTSLALAVVVVFPGCGESASPPSGEARSDDRGHDLSDDADSHDGHVHKDMRSLGSVTIAGTTLAVSVSGDIKPSSTVDLDLEVESGPIPAAVLIWIGDQAGTGALKSRAEAHDDHFHGQAEAPATLTGASLWIEIETDGGERQAAAIPLE